MKRILIFSRKVIAISETFIHRQIIALESDFDLTLAAFAFKNQDKFPIKSRKRVTLSWQSRPVRYMLAVAKRLIPSARQFVFSISSQTRLNGQAVDVIHAHYGWNGILILPFAKHKRIPLVVSFHGKDASAALSNETYRRNLKGLFDYSSAIIVCSQHMIEKLDLARWQTKVHFIPYGVDTEFFKATPLPNKDQRLRIVHAGRIVEKKGVPDLIRVFKELVRGNPDLELHILGSGPELDLCKELAYGEQRVVFYGEQTNTFTRDLINSCDIFVLNSRTASDGDMEGLPNALLEAMSLSRPVVSTVHAGIPAAVSSYFNGILVPENDNIALANAIQELIGNESLRMALGSQARKTVLEQFSIEIMNRRLCELFTSIK